jgi:uncharacterized protein YcbK (DUF882 family)
MKLISPHFSLEEVSCHDGTPYPDDWINSRLKPLLEAAEWIRERTGVLHVSSGYRTPQYNDRINDGKGGAKNSQHCQGRALDLVPLKTTVARLGIVAQLARAEGLIRGIGFYNGFVHIDTRPDQIATWRGSRTNDQNQVA